MGTQQRSSGDLKSIVYLGDDVNYFSHLKNRFISTYKDIKFEFSSIHDEDEETFFDIFIKIFNLNPCIIYLDFSVNPLKKKKLAAFIHNDAHLNKISCVALLENKKNINFCLEKGIDLFFIKCGETFDAFYAPCVMQMSKFVKVPSFAEGLCMTDIFIEISGKIIAMTPTIVQAELNVKLNIGDVIELSHHIDPKLNRSNKFIVKFIQNDCLKYDFLYSYELAYVFLDKPVDVATDDEFVQSIKDDIKRREARKKLQEKRRWILEEYKQDLAILMQNNKKYIMENAQNSEEISVTINVYIVDRQMSIGKNSFIDSNTHEITFKFSSIFEEGFTEVIKFKPQIIVFNLKGNFCLEKIGYDQNIMDDETISDKVRHICQETLKNFENEQVQILKSLIAVLENEKEYFPMIIVLNGKKQTSETLQQEHDYLWMISYPQDPHIEMILSMVKMLTIKEKKKQELILYNQQPSKESKYFLHKNHKQSFITWKHQVTIIKMTESEIIFTSPWELRTGLCKINFPIKMFITIIPIDGKAFVIEDKKKIYKAIIHFIDENDKKELRKFINKIFFRNDEQQFI